MKDSSTPIDPHLSEALRQLKIEPGLRVPEGTLRGDTARIQAAREAFQARVVDGAATPSRRAGRVRRGVTTSRSWIGIAVAVLCVIGVTMTLVYRSESKASTTHYRTAPGQVSRVVLLGGTVMTLAPATSVAVSRTAVDVVGEAYFSVAPSTSHPFMVRTSNTVVQVLGTRFSVRRYPDESQSRVVVEGGRVEVRRRMTERREPAILSSQMVALVTDSGVTVSSGIATRDYTGWLQGTLVFDGIPVRDVVAELSRVYGAQIRVADSALANERIIAEVAISRRPLTQVLDFISFMIDAHYTRVDSSFVLLAGRSEKDIPTGSLPRNRSPQPEKMYGR